MQVINYKSDRFNLSFLAILEHWVDLVEGGVNIFLPLGPSQDHFARNED